jgi:uncharacterized protein YkwD
MHGTGPQLTALALFLLSALGCATPAPPSAPSSTPTPGAPLYSAEVGYCVERTNRYRSSVGRSALDRSAALEEYAAAAARTDGLAHVAHQHARTTNSGNGLSRAENAILWWSLRHYGSVQRVIRDGLAEMWGQGASGQHYRNLVGSYSEVGCGVFVNGDEVTVVQAFR